MSAKYTPGLIIATAACLIGSSLHRGYTMTELNPLQSQIRAYLRIFATHTTQSSNNTTVAVVNEFRVTELWSLYSSIIYVGKIIGTLTVSTMADHLGRKNTILIVTVVGGILSLLQNVAIYTNVYSLLLIGRIFDGYWVGVSAVLTSVYLIEISPEHLRWGFAAADLLFMTSGSIVTAILALPPLLGTSSRWPLICIVGAALLLPILMLACQPEGPKFLIQKNKGDDVIISSIHHYQGTDVNVRAVLEKYQEQTTPLSSNLLFRQFALFGQKRWRKHVLLTLSLSAALAFTGTSAIVGYLTSIIADAGVNYIDAQRCYLGITVFRTLLSVVIALNIDKFGSRRNLLLYSLWTSIALFIGMIMCTLIDVYVLKSAHIFLVVVKVFLVVAWSGLVCLINPLCVMTNLECYPQYQRAAAGAAFLFTAYISGWGITAAYPTIQSKLGTSSVALFVPVLVVATIYLQIKLPETKLQDIDAISHIIAFGRSGESRVDEASPLIEHTEDGFQMG